jgi:hypothetical protein
MKQALTGILILILALPATAQDKTKKNPFPLDYPPALPDGKEFVTDGYASGQTVTVHFG